MELIATSHKYRKRRASVEEVPCLSIQDLSQGFSLMPDGQKIKISPPSLFSNISFILLSSKDNRLLQTVYLEYTNQNFGGHRKWFKCPCCGRRCSKLHIYEAILGCRICFGLTYKSKQLSLAKHHELQALKIENRLGEYCHYMTRLHPEKAPSRPKYVHMATYKGLVESLKHHKSYALVPLYKIMKGVNV